MRRHVLTRLRSDQICSNGKAVVTDREGRQTLYDIDSLSKQILAWSLNLERGVITEPRVVVDLTRGDVFPDGMILTPDQKSLIVALFDPRDVDHGEAHMYDIESGELQTVWRCELSPRVTCPQLIRRDNKTHLVLTTADEGMSPEQRQRCTNAGCMFVSEIPVEGLNENPTIAIYD